MRKQAETRQWCELCHKQVHQVAPVHRSGVQAHPITACSQCIHTLAEASLCTWVATKSPQHGYWRLSAALPFAIPEVAERKPFTLVLTHREVVLLRACGYTVQGVAHERR